MLFMVATERKVFVVSVFFTSSFIHTHIEVCEYINFQLFNTYSMVY